MTNKNSVYTVTPPDLKLNLIGPSVLLMGVSLADYTPYADIYDKMFPEVEITFFVFEEAFDPEHTAWLRAACGMVTSIFVNVDTITPEELFLAMQAEKDERVMVFWVSENKTNPTLVSLLNSYAYQVFANLESVEQYLLREYGKAS